LNWEERFALDVEYVNNMSLSFDIKILYLTIKKVLKRSDIVLRGEGSVIDFHEYRRNQKTKAE